MLKQILSNPLCYGYSKILKHLPLKVSRSLVNKFDSNNVKANPTVVPQLLVDVSVLVQHDAGTGIQRVVKKTWKQLEILQSNGALGTYQLRPVYATRKNTFRYVKGKPSKYDKHVDVNKGDIFLGLDWSAHLLTANESVLLEWKKKGVQLNFVLYDLLPQTNSGWFTKATVIKHRNWLKTLMIYSDQILSISYDVENEAEKYFRKFLPKSLYPKMSVIPLGADFYAGNDIKLNVKEQEDVSKLDNKKFVLIVGTVEPRKGHIELLKAFDKIWDKQPEITLVFAGKVGWNTQELQDYIFKHHKLNTSLFWFNQVSDGMLNALYQKSDLVVVASKGEGYGLPVVEALQHRKKLLVRDLAVFREIAKNQAYYFKNDDPEILSEQILSLLMSDENESLLDLTWLPHSWKDASNEILKLILSLKN